MRSERWLAADVNGAEPRDWPRTHRQRQAREVALVIDLDVLLADLGAGEARLSEPLGQREPAGDHVRRDNRIARLHGEGIAQFGCLHSGSIEPRQVDRGKAVLRPGVSGQDYAERLAGFLRPRLHLRIIIALAAQQLREEVGVGSGATADLRGIGRVLALGFEGRLLAEVA